MVGPNLSTVGRHDAEPLSIRKEARECPRRIEGTRALFAGAFGALRNPAGHRQIDYDDLSEAAEAVQLVAVGRTAKASGMPSGES